MSCKIVQYHLHTGASGRFIGISDEAIESILEHLYTMQCTYSAPVSKVWYALQRAFPKKTTALVLNAGVKLPESNSSEMGLRSFPRRLARESAPTLRKGNCRVSQERDSLPLPGEQGRRGALLQTCSSASSLPELMWNDLWQNLSLSLTLAATGLHINGVCTQKNERRATLKNNNRCAFYV